MSKMLRLFYFCRHLPQINLNYQHNPNNTAILLFSLTFKHKQDPHSTVPSTGVYPKRNHVTQNHQNLISERIKPLATKNARKTFEIQTRTPLPTAHALLAYVRTAFTQWTPWDGNTTFLRVKRRWVINPSAWYYCVITEINGNEL